MHGYRDNVTPTKGRRRRTIGKELQRQDFTLRRYVLQTEVPSNWTVSARVISDVTPNSPKALTALETTKAVGVWSIPVTDRVPVLLRGGPGIWEGLGLGLESGGRREDSWGGGLPGKGERTGSGRGSLPWKPGENQPSLAEPGPPQHCQDE